MAFQFLTYGQRMLKKSLDMSNSGPLKLKRSLQSFSADPKKLKTSDGLSRTRSCQKETFLEEENSESDDDPFDLRSPLGETLKNISLYSDIVSDTTDGENSASFGSFLQKSLCEKEIVDFTPDQRENSNAFMERISPDRGRDKESTPMRQKERSKTSSNDSNPLDAVGGEYHYPDGTTIQLRDDKYGSRSKANHPAHGGLLIDEVFHDPEKQHRPVTDIIQSYQDLKTSMPVDNPTRYSEFFKHAEGRVESVLMDLDPFRKMTTVPAVFLNLPSNGTTSLPSNIGAPILPNISDMLIWFEPKDMATESRSIYNVPLLNEFGIDSSQKPGGPTAFDEARSPRDSGLADCRQSEKQGDPFILDAMGSCLDETLNLSEQQNTKLSENRLSIDINEFDPISGGDQETVNLLEALPAADKHYQLLLDAMATDDMAMDVSMATGLQFINHSNNDNNTPLKINGAPLVTIPNGDCLTLMRDERNDLDQDPVRRNSTDSGKSSSSSSNLNEVSPSKTDRSICNTSQKSDEVASIDNEDRSEKYKKGISHTLKSKINKGIRRKGKETGGDVTLYKRPQRPCPFCNINQSQLQRHIRLSHKDLDEVAENSKLPKQSNERKKNYVKFRKMGIFQHNHKQASLENPAYESERSLNQNLICCSQCKGFYSRKSYYKHKMLCIQEEDTTTLPTGLSVKSILTLNDKADIKFNNEISSKFINDDIGNLCRNDKYIEMIGKRLFQRNLRKVDKIMETRKAVMNDMRLLARLFLAFKDVATEAKDAREMFLRKNFDAIEHAIENITCADGKLKHGMKISLFYLMKSSAKIIMASHLASNEDDKSSEVEKFVQLLDLNQNVLFGDAVYAINLSRQERLRMPEQQTNEEDLAVLRSYTTGVISKIASEYQHALDKHDYINLRDSICCRLTLFNARRGGEPSRLKLSNYFDAINERWVKRTDVEKLPLREQKLFQEYSIAYQTGKGNHLVPVLIPRDCLQGLAKLANLEIRKAVGITKSNKYVFANTESSDDHVNGWKAINRMCIAAGVERADLVTASKQRHHISTLYCGLDLPDQDRQFFYKHMGHTREVNQGTYQHPLPVMEMIKVGKHLADFDKASNEKSFVSDRPRGTTESLNTASIEKSADNVLLSGTTESLNAGVERADLVTASKQRHHISTLYCGLDLPDQDRQFFYKHMGHTREVNQGTYQHPLPVMEMIKVGKHLADFDKASNEKSFVSDRPRGTTESLNTASIEKSADNVLLSGTTESLNAVSKTVEVTSDVGSQNKVRDYHQWSEDASKLVTSTFMEWISMPEGNALPRKSVLVEFLGRSTLSCSYQQLRSKIMNEQKKKRHLQKTRMDKMRQS